MKRGSGLGREVLSRILRRSWGLLAVLAIACRAPVELTPGSMREGTLAPGERHQLVLTLAAGDFVELEIEQLDTDLVLHLRAPAGEPPLRVDTPTGAKGAERLLIVAPVAGCYRVGVESLEEKAEGAYRARVVAWRRATAADERRAQAYAARARADELRRAGTTGGQRGAAAQYRAAIDGFNAVGEVTQERSALRWLATVLDADGDPRGAVSARREALRLSRELGEDRAVARLLAELGNGLRAQGELDLAEQALTEALGLWRTFGDGDDQADVLNALAGLAVKRGRFALAEERYQESLALWQPSSTINQVRTRVNFGVLYRVLGDHLLALEQLEKARDLLPPEAAPEDRAWVTEETARILARRGSGEEALRLYREALELRRGRSSPGDLAYTLEGLARLHYDRQEWSLALATYREALQHFRRAGDPIGEASVRVSAALVEAHLGRPEEAQGELEEVLARSRGDHNPRVLVAAEAALARVLRLRGRLPAARQLALSAVECVEALRLQAARADHRAHFLADEQDTFDIAVDILLDLHRAEPEADHLAEAFAVTERSRARWLLEAFPPAPQRAPPDPVAPAPVLPLSEVQKELARDQTTLIQLDLGEERSYLWLVTATDARVWPLREARVLEAAATRLHRLLQESHRRASGTRPQRALEEMSRLLLEPLQDHLTGRRLLIIPDGALHLVPWAALPWPGAGDRGEPLVSHFDAVYAPSTSVAIRARRAAARRPRAPQLLALLADPVFDPRDPRLAGPPRPAPGPTTAVGPGSAVRVRAGWHPHRLPFSGLEAEAVWRLVPAHRSLLATGARARKDLVLAGSLEPFRFLHFATHGILDSNHPERSALLLSTVDEAGRSLDGELFTHEVAALSLNADLVVLSACETGLGTAIRGEGLVGLTQGFFRAGAAQVLVSLWPIQDRATAELMRHFYQGLLVEGLAPEEALARAQRSLSRQAAWRAPYYWAGFVIQGLGSSSTKDHAASFPP
jgi:CHAT domain-containing protein